MQPTQYPVNFHELYARWRSFVEQGVLDPQVDPLVAMSWRRRLAPAQSLYGRRVAQIIR